MQKILENTMAFINSVTYTNEDQFMEAVERAKAAHQIRESAAKEQQAEAAGLSFQEMLQRSYDTQNTQVAIANTPQTNPASNPQASSNVQASSATASRSTRTPAGAEALDAYFQKAADTYGISSDVLKAVAKLESNYTTDVVSRSGAVGVMQLMPATAAYLGVTNPYDAEDNIMGGAKLLSQLYSKYNGNLDLTLAAYNAGSGAVDSYGGVPSYAESYVAKVKANLGL